ncbi:MAG: 16S rRNA (guanine(527)-N(7))-methyltransferase RsmG, partial [bacterium]|nr:16S rRNA (guanine(527)-N(7))-methyltransferase RsmG [bacterium]
LQEWGSVHNLTSIKSTEKIIFNHYIDCFYGLAALPKKNVWDFGSGAGFPGLVAAVYWAQEKIVLVEASRKKCSFLNEAVRRMELNNVQIENRRVEELTDVPYALTRATFSSKTFAIATKAVAVGGELALWLGKTEEFTLKQLIKQNFCEIKSSSYEWSGISERKVVLLSKI